MDIKIASQADSREWSRLRAALWPDVPQEMHDKEIAAMLSNTGRFVTYLSNDSKGHATGFIEVSIHEIIDEGCVVKHIGYIEGWYVEPDSRRKGYGTDLIKAAEKWVSEQGLTEIAVDTNLDNLPSQSAYQNLGYAEQDRLILYRKVLKS
jgi:aminoglycoside 6'-N-acetyltransferase I